MKTIQKTVLFVILFIPIMEMYLLIEVGSFIGVIPTLILVMLTAFLGAALVRQQGFATWQRLQSSLAQGIMPAYELVEGLLLLIGGLLLLMPGFFTDALGLICLLPITRQRIARYLVEHRLLNVMQAKSPFQTQQARERDALEGEFSKED